MTIAACHSGQLRSSDEARGGVRRVSGRGGSKNTATVAREICAGRQEFLELAQKFSQLRFSTGNTSLLNTLAQGWQVLEERRTDCQALTEGLFLITKALDICLQKKEGVIAFHVIGAANFLKENIDLWYQKVNQKLDGATGLDLCRLSHIYNKLALLGADLDANIFDNVADASMKHVSETSLQTLVETVIQFSHLVEHGPFVQQDFLNKLYEQIQAKLGQEGEKQELVTEAGIDKFEKAVGKLRVNGLDGPLNRDAMRDNKGEPASPKIDLPVKWSQRRVVSGAVSAGWRKAAIM